MRFAIAAAGNEVATHFGRCEYYQILDVADGKIVRRYRLDSPGHGEPGQLPTLLASEGVKCIVAGGMGPRAQELLVQMGIETMLGISGPLTDIAAKLAAHELVSGEDQCVH